MALALELNNADELSESVMLARLEFITNLVLFYYIDAYVKDIIV